VQRLAHAVALWTVERSPLSRNRRTVTWEVRYAQAVALGLTERIIDSEGLYGLYGGDQMFIKFIENRLGKFPDLETRKFVDVATCFYRWQHVATNRE